MKICFASNNAHKIKELNEMLSSSFEIVGLKDLEIVEEIAETGKTLEQNASIKAHYVFDKFNIPVFADDSGLLVNSLDGQPGVYSARYAGPEKDDEKNIDLLLKNLTNSKDRGARFETVIALIDKDGTEYHFKGSLEGKITSKRKGTNGFGYDPIFIPKGHRRTFAEMTSEEKNNISHRQLAVKQLIAHLQSNK